MYQIIDGVRRAKLASNAGRAAILAEIHDSSGRCLDVKPIPLDQILSRKGILDLRNDVREKVKYLRLQSYFLAGHTFPPIIVTVGSQGTLVAQVQVLL